MLIYKHCILVPTELIQTDAVALAEGLNCCSNIQTLDLSSNSIGSVGAVGLAEG